jgi:hypothetical protein
MEDFRTDTEPQEMRISFKREAMATACARYLTTEMDIEVWVSQQTVFGQLDAKGQRNDQTTFYVRAFCTWEKMKEAAEEALLECIDHDQQLVEMGVLPAWKHGCIIPINDYV